MTFHLPQAAYDAMAKQKRRTQKPRTLQDEIDDLRVKLARAERELANEKKRVKELETENDTLALKAHHAKKVASADGSTTGKFHDGIEYVNQKDAALILGVRQDQISKWVAAKKFEMIAVPGIKKLQLVRTSVVKPVPGKPGRKKKS